MTFDLQSQDRIWWHSALQVVAAMALLAPAVIIIGFGLALLSFLQGETINFLMRGFQFGLAAFASLYLPSLVLKRSHTVVVAAVFCTAVTTLYIAMMVVVVAGGVNYALWEWLEIVATVIGFVGGSIAYAVSDRD